MATPQNIPKGTTLFRAGDPCPGFVVLSQGTIRVTMSAANGREVVLYRVRPGDVCLQTFSCLIDGRRYSAEGVAETDLSAEIIPPAAFHQKLAEEPAFRQQVFAAIAHRFADFEQLVEDVALSGFDARLARALPRLAGEDQTVHATHEQLAAETASGRAVVTRTLSEFTRRGLVELSRGKVALLRLDALRNIAEESG